MRLVNLLTFLLLIVAAATVFATSADEVVSHQTTDTRHHNHSKLHLKIPRFFEFNSFKKIFSKSYENFAEESRRAKLFFARAFKVFVSSVSFKHKRSTKYLKINHMSDWTPRERSAINNYGGSRRKELAEEAVTSVEEIPAADFEDVKEQLATIVEPEAGSEDMNELAVEPFELKHETVKKSLGELLSEEDSDLDGGSSPGSNDRVPDDGLMEPMLEEEAAQIDSQEGRNFLTRTILKLKDYWYGRNRDVADPSLPDEIFYDLRQSRCVARVRDQGHCGSCCVFAMIPIYEYHYCKQMGKLVPFSEQYVVDCDRGLIEGGCNGGFDHNVANFIGNYGIELAQYYRYFGTEIGCPYGHYKLTSAKQKMGQIKVKQTKLTYIKKERGAIAEALEKFGPLSVAIQANEDFNDYGGGVDMLEDCHLMDGHAMTLVGHGRENGLEYWLIRNSFSYRWGVHGYYKLSKGVSSRCLISVAYIEPKFEQNPNHDQSYVVEKVKENLDKLEIREKRKAKISSAINTGINKITLGLVSG